VGNRRRGAAAREQILRCAQAHGNLVVLDLREEVVICPANRFQIYALFPQCSVSMDILWGLKQQSGGLAVGADDYEPRVVLVRQPQQQVHRTLARHVPVRVHAGRPCGAKRLGHHPLAHRGERVSVRTRLVCVRHGGSRGTVPDIVRSIP